VGRANCVRKAPISVAGDVVEKQIEGIPPSDTKMDFMERLLKQRIIRKQSNYSFDTVEANIGEGNEDQWGSL